MTEPDIIILDNSPPSSRTNSSKRPIYIDLTGDDPVSTALTSLVSAPVQRRRHHQIQSSRNNVVDFDANVVDLVNFSRQDLIRKPIPTPAPKAPVQADPVASLKCAVCLTLAGPETALSATICGHIFCTECLDACMNQAKKLCPNCRKPLGKKGSTHRLYI